MSREEQGSNSQGDTGTTKENIPPASNAGNSNTNNNRSQSNKKGNQSTFSPSQQYNWKGSNEEVGLIMCLKSERYENKVLFTTFSEKLKNHVIQNFEHANDIVSIIDKYVDPVKIIHKLQPADLTKEQNKSEVAKMIQKEKVRNHIERLTKLDNNKMKLYGIIWGQCTTAVQEVIKGYSDFETSDSQFDCIWLLQKAKTVSAGLDERANIYYTLSTSIRQAFSVRQRDFETNDAYRKRFESHVMTLHLVGGRYVMSSPQILQSLISGTTTAADVIAEEQKMKAMMMILGADPARFSTLQQSLEEGVLLGRDEYPTTVINAYELLQSTCPVAKPSRFSKFKKNAKFRMGSLSFAQLNKSEGTGTPGIYDRIHPHVRCYNCNEEGHYRSQCPKSRQVTLTQFVLNQQEQSMIDLSWILLDTCSKVSVFAILS